MTRVVWMWMLIASVAGPAVAAPSEDRLPADGSRVIAATGHHGQIMSIVATPDGAFAATVAFDRIVRVIQRDGLRELARFVRAGEQPHTVALAADGSRIAIAYAKALVISEVRSGRELGRIEGAHACFAFDGGDLVYWRDGPVRWRAGTASQLATRATGCFAMGFTSAATLVIHDGTAFHAGEVTATAWTVRAGPKVSVGSLAFGPNLVAWSNETGVHIWRPADAAPRTVLAGVKYGEVAVVDNGTAVIHGGDKTQRIAVATGAAAPFPEREHATAFGAGTVIGGDEILCTASSQTGAPGACAPFASTGPVRSLAIAADGRLVVGADQARLRAWTLGFPVGVQEYSFRSFRTRKGEAVLSPDRKSIAQISSSEGVFVRPLLGDQRRELQHRRDPSYAGLAWSPDGAWIATTWRESIVRLRPDGKAHELVENILPKSTGAPAWFRKHGLPDTFTTRSPTGNPLRPLSYRKDGALLAVGIDDRVLLVRGDKVVATLAGPGGDEPPTALAFRPGTNELVVGFADGHVRSWDSDAPAKIVRDRNAGAAIAALAFDDAGKTLLVSSDDARVRVFDGDQVAAKQTLAPHATTALALAFLPRGRIATGHVDGVVRVLKLAGDPNPLAELIPLDLQPNDRADWIVVGADGRFEASLDGDGIAFYGVRDGRVLPFADFAAARRRPAVLEAALLDPADRPRRFPPGPTVIAQRWSRNFQALVFTPDGRELLAKTDTGVYAFDVASGLMRARLADGRGDAAIAVSNSAFYRSVHDLEVRDRVTGDLIASQRHEGTIIGRTPTGELVGRGHEGIAVYAAAPFQRLRTVAEKDVPPGAAAALSPDGAIIGATKQDGVVRTWATATLKERPPVRCSHEGDAGLALSAGGAWLACANTRGGIVAMRGDGTGAVVLRPSALLGSMQTIYAMSFHPTRPLLAVATLLGGYVYDLSKQGSELRLDAEDTRYDTIAWSPDGATLATSQLGGALLLFDAATGALLRKLTDRVAAIDRIARARPGVIALRDASYHLRTWDAATGHERGFEGGNKLELAWSADGKASAIKDGAKVVIASPAATIALGLEHVAKVALDDVGKRVFVGIQATLAPTCEVAAYDVATQRQLWTQHHDMQLRSLVRGEGGDLGMYFETKVPSLQPGHHRAIVLGPDGQVRGTYDSPWLMSIAGAAGGAWLLAENQRLARWNPKTSAVDRTTIPARDVAVSLDGARAVAVGERELHVVDIKTLATIAYARLPDAKLTSGVWLAPDLVATLVEDGAVKLWRVRGAALELAGTLYAAPRRGSVLVTPEGHYLASSEAGGALGFALGPQVYRFDQFDAAYNRPHLALGALGIAPKATLELYQAAYEKRRKRGVAEVTLANRLAVPAVELAEPLPLRVTGPTVAVKLRADGKQTAIARVNIRVNGIPLLGKAGLAVGGGATKYELARDVPLELGPNRIELEAENDQGIVALGRTAIVTRAGATAAPGTLHLITIGVSRYAEGNDLQYAAKDAEDVSRALSRHAGKVQKVLLRDDQVTRANVLGLRKQLEQTALEDTVIVFVAGHGMLDATDQYVFGTHDVRFATAERGIKFDELEALLDGIPARRRILILDTCHAGELDAEELAHLEKAERAGARGIRRVKAPPTATTRVDPRARAVAARQLFTNLRGGSGVTVIAASAGAEYSYELGAIKNGLFTHALIEGVEHGKADHDRDGAVLVSELLDFATIQVAEASNGFQVPQTRERNRELDFDLTPTRPHRVPLQFERCSTLSYNQPSAGYQCGALLANTAPLPAGSAPAAALDKLAVELAPGFPKHLAVTWSAAAIPGVAVARTFVARTPGYALDAHAGWIAVDPATRRQAVCIAADALPAAAERCKQVLPKLLLAAPPQDLY